MKLSETLTYKPVRLSFGTSGLRDLVSDMTDLECYVNTVGFLQFELKNGLKSGATIPIAGDLRHSTPRITQAIVRAVEDQGFTVDYCGVIPTPAIAFYAYKRNLACVMVTGSHIHDDRNGIKFYKTDGEVLKSDEAAIKEAVAEVRETAYNQDAEKSLFDETGAIKVATKLPSINALAKREFVDRYVSLFSPNLLERKHIVVYQHSSVARDMLIEICEKLGAKVTATGRSEAFIPIDTENVTPKDRLYFKELAQEFPDAFAIISADGDADRPFVIDKSGNFHRGDVVGCIVAKELGADFATFPVSASDAVDESLNLAGIEVMHTKVGSPYVIEAMQAALKEGKQKPVAWEVNGGFLTQADMQYQEKLIAALPTRDAFLPIFMCLAAAVHKNKSISQLFKELPARFTQAGLLDNFPKEDSQTIISRLAKNDKTSRSLIEASFTPKDGFDEVKDVNSLDGIRITFSNGDIAHIRPSGNAPQLRIYSVAGSQQRADKIVELGVKEGGTLQTLRKLI